ncbi:MAG: hypothetical protein QOF58_1620 [Pseudonocardiales bacterium]|nr:hypothetical protein [Pseudonocardiales bacterium]
MLGRPHRVEGTLSDGVVSVPPGTALPLDGKYLGTLGGRLAELIVESGAVHASGQDGPAVLEFVDRL